MVHLPGHTQDVGLHVTDAVSNLGHPYLRDPPVITPPSSCSRIGWREMLISAPDRTEALATPIGSAAKVALGVFPTEARGRAFVYPWRTVTGCQLPRDEAWLQGKSAPFSCRRSLGRDSAVSRQQSAVPAAGRCVPGSCRGVWGVHCGTH